MAFALGPRARAAGANLIGFPSIGSTNAEALARARAGECGPLWLVTDDQRGGHGRRQRPWSAPAGNLAASYLAVMDVAAPVAATLGFVAGLALVETLARIAARDILTDSRERIFRLKWPNDVLGGAAKIAGILLESERVGEHSLAVVVGIGVNVVAAPDDVPYPATSLAGLGVAVSAEDLFTALSDSWTDCLSIWNEGRGLNEIRTRWLAHAAGRGGPVTVQLGDRTLAGVFDTIDAQGRLVVVTGDGERVPVSAGDVYFGNATTRRDAGERI